MQALYRSTIQQQKETKGLNDGWELYKFRRILFFVVYCYRITGYRNTDKNFQYQVNETKKSFWDAYINFFQIFLSYNILWNKLAQNKNHFKALF